MTASQRHKLMHVAATDIIDQQLHSQQWLTTCIDARSNRHVSALPSLEMYGCAAGKAKEGKPQHPVRAKI